MVLDLYRIATAFAPSRVNSATGGQMIDRSAYGNGNRHCRRSRASLWLNADAANRNHCGARPALHPGIAHNPGASGASSSFRGENIDRLDSRRKRDRAET